jgi:GTP-binding protein HflX
LWPPVVQRVARVNPKFILGKGKLAELEIIALRAGAGTLLFDNELSPGQIRNLAEVTELKILDRTQLILDIFALNARTRSGKLQVEMAQLKYLQPRLVKQDRAMSRLMGGIGGRGPGETKLEIDRRRIRERIARIKKELAGLRTRRAAARAGRSGAGLPVVSLVGYTNAGKSTLLNTLTGSSVTAENRLFATLDPTTRRLRFPQETRDRAHRHRRIYPRTAQGAHGGLPGHPGGTGIRGPARPWWPTPPTGRCCTRSGRGGHPA